MRKIWMIIQKSGKYIWQYGKLVSGHVFTNDNMENLYEEMFY